MERYHRTALLLAALSKLKPFDAVAVLNELRFVVSISDEAAPTYQGQAAFLTAVNVLARTGGAISVEAPSVSIKVRLPWQGTLDSVAEQLALWAGGNVATGTHAAGLHIGTHPHGDRVLVAGDAWTAWIDDVGHPWMNDQLALGAIAAAHLGAARALHLALAPRLQLPTVSRAVASFSLGLDGVAVRSADVITIPSFALIGAGAVANAMLWAIAVGGLQVAGDLAIVDPQHLDATNLNRHLLAGVPDVGKNKAEVARDFVRRWAPNSRPVVAAFDGERDFADLIVSTVDNDDARYQIQATFPRLVLHGATALEMVGVAALEFTRGACLGCLFPRPQASLTAVIASESGLDEDLVSRVLANNGPVTEDMISPIAQKLGRSSETLLNFVGRSLREVYARELCGRLPATAIGGGAAATVAYVSGLSGTLLGAELALEPLRSFQRKRKNNYLQVAATYPEHVWRAFREKQEDCPLMCSSPALQEVALGVQSRRA